MHFKLKELLANSPLERGRIPEPTANPREVSGFADLENLIAHSLKLPQLIGTQTAEGNPLPVPTQMNRPFADEAILKRLLQFRDQIPPSPRVIRANRT